MPVTLSTEVGGRTLTIESGRLARLAGGSVTVRYGDTMVLGTANRSDPRPGLDFFPLTVDFEERMYAAGKIPGGFIKRESRPSEAAILAARLTDRPIRPLFPEGYKDDVQVVLTVLSTDQENDPDIIGTIAASAALTISDVPFQGPIAAARIGRINGEFVLNPTYSQLAESELDLIVSGTRDAIMMVEAGAKILPEAVMAEAILFGHRSLAPIIDLQLQLQRELGKAKRIPYLEPGTDSVLTFLDDMAAKKPFVVFDVETTSRDAKIGSLVEIAAVKVQGGKIADRWSTLVDPGQPIVGHQLHGLTDKDVKGAPAPAEAARQFLAWAGDATLVGHNVGFDLGFVEAALGDGTRIEQGRYLDTLTLAREAWPGPGRLQAGRPDRVLRPRAPTDPPCPARRRGHRGAPAPAGQGPAGARRGLQEGRRGDHPRTRQGHRAGRGRRGPGEGPPRLAPQQVADHPAAQEDRAPPRAHRRACAWTAATSTRSGRSPWKWGCCPAPTARRSSPAAIPRP